VGQSIRNPAPVVVALHLVGQHILHVEAVVRAHQVKGDFACFQLADQKLARHAEEVGGFPPAASSSPGSANCSTMENWLSPERWHPCRRRRLSPL
jgi:hypothetical protein